MSDPTTTPSERVDKILATAIDSLLRVMQNGGVNRENVDCLITLLDRVDTTREHPTILRRLDECEKKILSLASVREMKNLSPGA